MWLVLQTSHSIHRFKTMNTVTDSTRYYITVRLAYSWSRFGMKSISEASVAATSFGKQGKLAVTSGPSKVV